MVKENTTQSPGLILKLNILQKRDDVLIHIGQYYKNTNRRSSKSKVKASVKVLFLELRPLLVRYNDYDKVNGDDIKDFEGLKNLINSDDVEEVIKAFQAIDLILDRKKLTRWDTYKPIDLFDMEAENKANHV